MNRKRLPVMIFGIVLSTAWSATTLAQGMIVPDERVPIPEMRRRPSPRPLTPVTVKKLAVATEIVDAVAITRIDQVFFNPSKATIEGTYVFPLDDDISISKFSMFMNGKEVSGRVLDRDQARKTYESIVARLRDPALLEYLGTRMYQARIFPIPPGGEARIKLMYSQTLAIDDGLVRYRFPLGTGKHSAGPIGSLSLLVEIDSRIPIKSVFCPTHDAAVLRPSDSHASASLEAANLMPDHDFILYYSLSKKEFGLSLLTYRQPGEDGFFLARIAPKAKVHADEVLPKDICFVVDVSGSMAGEKMDQAKRALKFCLANLNPRDRFNVITFSHEPRLFHDELVRADEETVRKTRKTVDELQANGGTNMNDAVLAAMKTDSPPSDEKPYIIVLLTDGQPTIGVTDPNAILSNVRQANSKTVRLFVFGIGNDVNTKLLDRLAAENRGARNYVSDSEDIEVKVSSFYRKVANPVLSGLELSWGGAGVREVFPQTLPDLFSGGEVVIVGRYDGAGHQAIELTGSRYGRKHQFVYEANFPGVATRHDFIPRLWAIRKVAFLSDQIRLHGENEELKQAIIELAKEYGIITDYTAYLVIEESEQIVRRGGRSHVFADQMNRAPEARRRFAAAPAAQSAGSGRKANRVSIRDKKMALAGKVGGAAYQYYFEDQENGQLSLPPIKRVGNRTFYFSSGKWIDSAHDQSHETTKVTAYSREYFDLLQRHPLVAKFMALGERVVFIVQGKAYEVVPAL
ncbi:MAG: VWA domain-containing protein [Phycisphaerae bacterium]|nr:VWA domain-containing protein [Phycisphaerae bacterium]